MESSWFLLALSVLFVLYSIFHPVAAEKKVVDATYNLWNVMFNWEVRRFRIAQMVRITGSVQNSDMWQIQMRSSGSCFQTVPDFCLRMQNIFFGLKWPKLRFSCYVLFTCMAFISLLHLVFDLIIYFEKRYCT